ncbi:MAG: sulfite oxidase [Chloroflexota bacterium]
MGMLPSGKDATALQRRGRVGQPNLQVETVRERIGAARITPTPEVFVCQHHALPRFGKEAWSVRVEGVADEREVHLDEIRGLTSLTMTTVLQCAGNGRAFFGHEMRDARGPDWAVGASSNVTWTGARLADLLTLLGGPASSSARYLTASGGEPLPGRRAADEEIVERSIPIDKAYKDCILAWEMNGRQLPLEHGGPLRLIVPGYYGVNNVKWVSRIRVSAHESTARVQRSAYRVRPVGQSGDPTQPTMGEMNVKSFVTRPSGSAPISPGSTRLEGVAFSGERAVTSVELTIDGGNTWQMAEFLDPIVSPYAWRRFASELHLPAGTHVINSRATDSAGRVQPQYFPANERGYGNNAWTDHAAKVEVVE